MEETHLVWGTCACPPLGCRCAQLPLKVEMLNVIKYYLSNLYIPKYALLHSLLVHASVVMETLLADFNFPASNSRTSSEIFAIILVSVALLGRVAWQMMKYKKNHIIIYNNSSAAFSVNKSLLGEDIETSDMMQKITLELRHRTHRSMSGFSTHWTGIVDPPIHNASILLLFSCSDFPQSVWLT